MTLMIEGYVVQRFIPNDGINLPNIIKVLWYSIDVEGLFDFWEFYQLLCFYYLFNRFQYSSVY